MSSVKLVTNDCIGDSFFQYGNAIPFHFCNFSVLSEKKSLNLNQFGLSEHKLSKSTHPRAQITRIRKEIGNGNST